MLVLSGAAMAKIRSSRVEDWRVFLEINESSKNESDTGDIPDEKPPLKNHGLRIKSQSGKPFLPSIVK